jgi:hypothetical protein
MWDAAVHFHLPLLPLLMWDAAVHFHLRLLPLLPLRQLAVAYNIRHKELLLPLRQLAVAYNIRHKEPLLQLLTWAGPIIFRQI